MRRQMVYHVMALPMSAVGFAVGAGGVSYGTALLLILRPIGVCAARRRGGCRLGVHAARHRAGPAVARATRGEALAARLAELARSRSQAIEAADAERRRIERDLHEGAQQRLVALAMTLGMARNELHVDVVGRVGVTVVRDRGRLRRSVADDGVGGASARVGGGLEGLAQRVGRWTAVSGSRVRSAGRRGWR